ncbi:alpha/beta hydrolase [Streptomyces sp. NPDC051567]|uniref:alpha/beta hydrolase n=1 Tax=Streptomyces sp. NPDC051567 TaxID=3365660 RepID=UPI00378C5114
MRTLPAACLLLLASLGAAPPPAPAGTPATTPPPPAAADPLERFRGQRLRWGDCPGTPGAPDAAVPAGMRCASVSVPLDYDAPGKGTLKVALARIRATGPGEPLGSLLLNYGGPGGPGIENLAADPTAFAELGERYDLVTFDPRGVGHSEPVSCAGSQEIEDAAGADAASQLAALRAVVRRCELASGPVLPYIGTVNVARDLDVIRRVLGDRKLNYLGFSYGTRLGAVYAAQYPRTTGRMVLDGVDTLSESLTEQALVSARAQQRALDNFLTWCTRRRGCVYGTDARAAAQKVEALVARLDRAPLTGQDGSYFTGQDAVTAIAAALYSPRMWPALAESLALAESRGDPVGLLQLGGPANPSQDQDGEEDGDGDQEGGDGDGDGGQGRADGPGAVPADNAEAALAAVNCADDPDRSADKVSPTAVEKELAELRAAFVRASQVFGPRQLMTVLSCYGRPPGTEFIRRIDHPAGVPPMLLVGTRGDPATPYEWAEETARRLGPAVVLEYEGDGHTAYASSPCVRGYVNRFLTEGHLPGTTRSCPANG